MRNLKPLVAVVLTAIGAAFVATFQVAEPPVIGATTGTTTSPLTAGTARPATATTTATAANPTSPTIAATAATAANPTSATGTTATSGTTATATSPTAAPATTRPAAASTTVQFADGTYTGSAVREPWGTFQVELTISGGKIVSVTVVAAPTDGHSSRINNSAVPLLAQAAIASQSAQIDTISGATWTSESYATSLQAALDAASAAAATTQVAG